jgi:anti-sigma factor RsiW
MRSPEVTYDMLLRYAANELPEDRAALIEAHLARNPAAAETVARFRIAAETLARDDTVETPADAIKRGKAIFRDRRAERPTLLDQIATVIASLVYDSRAQPALAGYRGGGSAFQLSFRSDLAEVDLDAEPLEAEEPSSPDGWRIIGQINAAGDPAPFHVELSAAGANEPARRTAADEHGVFTILAPQGRYDVRLRSATCEVVLPGIELS